MIPSTQLLQIYSIQLQVLFENLGNRANNCDRYSGSKAFAKSKYVHKIRLAENLFAARVSFSVHSL